jgi:hypothetical protein
MDLTFDHASHSYTLNGKDVPSVTQVMDAEGLTSFSFADESHRQRGTWVHDIAELVARNWKGNTVEEIIQNSRWSPETTEPSLVPYGRACALFLLESGFRPTVIEQIVGSERLGICGKLDAYGPAADGSNWLVDVKSGQPYEGAWIQTALYSYCLEETLQLKTDWRVVVQLKPDGSYRLFGPPRPAGGVDLAVGMAVCTVYRWRKDHRML